MGRYTLGHCRLSKVLADANMTQQELADKTGYSKQEISNWANMVKKRMDLEIAISIAEAIGCDVRELYVLHRQKASDPRGKR